MVRDPRAVTDVALRAIEHGAATSALLHACHDGGAAPLLLSDVLVPAGDADDGDNAGRAVCVARVRAHDVGELAARAVSASRDSLPRDVPAPASAPLFAPSSQRDDVTRAVAVRVDGEPAPPYPTPVAKASAAPRRVCFGVPSRTADRFGQVLFPRVTDLSLFRVFLRSLLHYSRADLEAGAFDFVVLLGYDAGDPVYDEPALMRRVRARWADEAHGAPLRLRTVRFGSEYRSRVVWIWNELFHLAQHERCDLFFQTNDDAGIAFSGWAQRYHDALMGFERAPGFGVVGPVEHDTGTVLHDTITQAVVHAPTHFDVFGTFYPWTFLNWYSDNWLTEVYAEVPGAVHRSRDDIVHNSRPQGSARYHIARQGHLLMVELHKGKRRAADYVAARERVQGR